MQYQMLKLQADVMALSGENPRQRQSVSAVDAHWANDAIAIKIKALLPICGKTIIMEASLHTLGGGEQLTPQFSCKKMPCELYAIDMQLPATTARIVTINMPGWEKDVWRVITADSTEWARQWSSECGIAGCPTMPIAYIGTSQSGVMLRAMSCEKPFAIESDTEEDNTRRPRVSIWRLPEIDEVDNFHFPEYLYSELVHAIANELSI